MSVCVSVCVCMWVRGGMKDVSDKVSITVHRALNSLLHGNRALYLHTGLLETIKVGEGWENS